MVSEGGFLAGNRLFAQSRKSLCRADGGPWAVIQGPARPHFLSPSRLREGLGEGLSPSAHLRQALPQPLPQAGGEQKSQRCPPKLPPMRTGRGDDQAATQF